MEPFATTSYPAGVKAVQASVSNHPGGQTLPFLEFITVIAGSMVMHVSDYMCAPTYLGIGAAEEWRAQWCDECVVFCYWLARWCTMHIPRVLPRHWQRHRQLPEPW